MSGPDATLRELLRHRRVLVTVGSGGVGKTTTSAAMAVAAARMGRRVLCLTIDPAKRLATSLGLSEMRGDPQVIEPARIGATGAGSMTALMLDTRRTFDELVEKYASDETARARILANPVYRQMAGSLAGTPEYMAMEKLHALRDDPAYDLIVLDTPPTANALDFLDAPDRMIEAVDSPAVRGFVQAFQGAGKLSFHLLSRAVGRVLQGLSRFTGAGFLEQVAAFLTDIQSLFGGFKERARAVRESLRSDEVAFVLVTSTDPVAVSEAAFFGGRLEEAGMKLEAVVVNRVREVSAVEVAGPERLANVAEQAGVHDALPLAAAALKAYREGLAWARRDAVQLRRIKHELRSVSRVVSVPAFDEDVHDVAALTRVAEVLAAPAR